MRRSCLAAAPVVVLLILAGCSSPHAVGTSRPPGGDSASAPIAGASVPDSSSVEAAMAVLRDYYAAIAERDYRRAHLKWEGAGAASGKSLDSFAAGFSNTASVTASLGAPGPIGAAAGSRYVEIPVVVAATTRDGVPQRFHGAYVLRRSEVEGASAEQRRWHLYSATIARDSAVVR